MSKNSKIERTAKIHSGATGIRWYQSKTLAAEGVISPAFPIPDAVSLQQQHFEAQILFALVEAFGQTDFCDYFLGLDNVVPDPAHLTITVSSGDAGVRAVSRLLPVFDPEYGGVVGVRGLRMSNRDGMWVGRSVLLDNASPELVIGGPDDVIQKGIEVWEQTAGKGMRPESGPQASHEERRPIGLSIRPENRTRLEDTNLVLSRVLRRQHLFRSIDATHGLINVYHHAFHDLQLEWCCGPTIERIHEQAIKSGMFMPAPSTHRLNGTRLTPPPCAPQNDRLKWKIGLSEVALRRNLSLHDGWSECGRQSKAAAQ